VREVFEAEDVGVNAGVVALLGLPGAACVQVGAVEGVGPSAVLLGGALGDSYW
jgi:hypothetical protein